jgi:hypothetical protein
MPEPHGIGSKIKRLFVEEEEGGAPASAAAEAAGAAQQQAPAPAAAAAATPQAPVEPAKLDCPGIYRAAGLTDEDLSQVEHAEQLLKTLPSNLPLETQKQILEGTLKTFGVDPARIQQTIQRQQRALAGYASVVRHDAEKRDADARSRIDALRAEALKLERAIEERARGRAGVELSCKMQSDAVSRMVAYLPAAASPVQDK